MVEKDVFITKNNGEREIFNIKKLESSLEKSGASQKSIKEITEHVGKELEDGMSTAQIYKHAFFLLDKLERPAALKYSLRRAIADLGPSGFPFEDFVADIFKERGYTVETDKIVRGGCVDHEIDVVAYNENKLIMVETKFHNQPGIKSDLKVALYVKARFDDLHTATFNYGGKERKLDEGWLITNTKFTLTAIQYGMCQHLKMIGWNYPEKGNLQDMIEDAGFHPLTALTTLEKHHKQMLLKKGVVLAREIDSDKILKEIGLSEDTIANIRKEIRGLQNK